MVVGGEKNSIIGRWRVAAVCDGKIWHNSCSSYVQVSSLTSTYQLVEISLLVIFVNVTINTIIAKLSTKICIVLHMFVMDLSIIIFVVIFTDAIRKWKSGNHSKDLLANTTSFAKWQEMHFVATKVIFFSFQFKWDFGCLRHLSLLSTICFKKFCWVLNAVLQYSLKTNYFGFNEIRLIYIFRGHCKPTWLFVASGNFRSPPQFLLFIICAAASPFHIQYIFTFWTNTNMNTSPYRHIHVHTKRHW